MRPPERIGPYEVTAELGRGGMGVVFAARDPRSGDEVAVKVVAADGPLDERQLRRFTRERELLSRLAHPHVVRVRDVGEVGGRPFIAMDLVRGEALDVRLRRGPLPVHEAVTIARKLAQALAHAHQLGVIHRDVKPANVLMDGDEPRLSDFGLARDLDPGRSRLSRTGQLLGTPAYLPPEQAQGQHELVGPTSDVYALGATLYALLTAEPPFKSDSIGELLDHTVSRPAPAPSRARPEVDPKLDAIVLRCLAKAQEDRFPTADELARALGRWLHAPARRRPRRRALIVGALAAVGAIGAAVVTIVIAPAPPTPPPPPVEALAAPPPPVAPEPAPVDPPPVVEDARTALERGQALLEAKDDAGARDACLRAVALDPSKPAAWHTLGVAQFHLGDQAAAVEAFTRAIALYPTAIGYYERGNAERERGNVRAAVDDYSRALELDPTMGIALINRAIDRQELGDLPGALEDLERAIALGGDPAAKGYFNRGNVRFDQGDRASAFEDYSRAIALDPGYADAYANRASARVSADPAAALADYERALALIEPDDRRVAGLQRRIDELKKRFARPQR